MPASLSLSLSLSLPTCSTCLPSSSVSSWCCTLLICLQGHVCIGWVFVWATHGKAGCRPRTNQPELSVKTKRGQDRQGRVGGNGRWDDSQLIQTIKALLGKPEGRGLQPLVLLLLGGLVVLNDKGACAHAQTRYNARGGNEQTKKITCTHTHTHKQTHTKYKDAEGNKPESMSSMRSWGWRPSTVQPTLCAVPRISCKPKKKKQNKKGGL